MPTFGRLSLVSLLVAALAFVSGCKKEEPFVGGKPRKPITSVVSLSPSTTEIFATYGNSQTLRGKTGACNYPGGLELAEVVVTTKPDFEKIAALQPQLVLYDESLYSEAEIEKIKALGAEVLALKPTSVESMIDYCYRVGRTQVDPMRLNDYVQKVRAAMSLASANPPPAGTSAAVLIGNPREGEYYIAGVNTYQADLIRISGAEPKGPDANKFVPLNVETLLQWNPTILITTKDNAINIARDPRLKSLGAIQKNRVAEMDPDVLLRAGARADRAITVVSGLLESLSRPQNPSP
ncbi:MAG TPA: helical backbone metal receptor [Fimbriimonadaceae bacterium]|nr:helical backbone metal receptor [Fimbriimonadaceae bacterium]HRJ34204.1 helical backbone metal receptor [Fimbriimonadaceae bacterium]